MSEESDPSSHLGQPPFDPRQAAANLVAAHAGNEAWLDAFAESLDRFRAAGALARVLETWALSQADAARAFGVSRQAVGKWLDTGPPPERTKALADVAAATDLLVRHIKRDRIAAVVRRPMAARGGCSLLEVLEQTGSRAVLEACRVMFAFERAHR